MSLPTTKQRIWHALRINKQLTIKELGMIVDAKRSIIYAHLTNWDSLRLLKIAKVQRGLYPGARQLAYSLVNPQIIDPP
jgi:hypothetical protein